MAHPYTEFYFMFLAPYTVIFTDTEVLQLSQYEQDFKDILAHTLGVDSRAVSVAISQVNENSLVSYAVQGTYGNQIGDENFLQMYLNDMKIMNSYLYWLYHGTNGDICNLLDLQNV